MITQTLIRATHEDLAGLPEGQLAQLIDGEIIVSPSPTPYHQRIVMRLAFALSEYVEAHSIGNVFIAPIDVKLTDWDVFQPDIVYFDRSKANGIRQDKITVAPDLVVEVLSPSTARFDYGRKRERYAAAGVKEYWIIDPEHETLEVHVLDGDHFRIANFFRKQDTLTSDMFSGFTMALSNLLSFPTA